MKKVVTILTVIIPMCLSTFAQVNPHAIGLRFGGYGGVSGAEISYQHGIGETNRLELDFGFRGNKNYKNGYISGIYQWDWNLTSSLNGYVGPSVALGFYNWDNGVSSSSGLNLGIGGQIGLEFDFNKLGAPILLSLDSRPMFDFIGYNSGFILGAALGIRYVW